MGVRLSIDPARDLAFIPGIQLRRFDGVLGRESGAEPGIANPAELEGRLISRPLLRGRSTGELGALLARSWLTANNDGGGGRSKGSGGGTVLGSEE